MSTSSSKIADKTTDNSNLNGNSGSSNHNGATVSVKPKKTQTPYKPVLATLVKVAMEDSVKDAIEAQKIMEEILEWLEEERAIRDALRAEISALAPLDHRVQALLQKEIESLLRIGKLENRIAKLALKLTAMERRLTTTLINSRRAVAPPKERLARRGGDGGDGEDGQQGDDGGQQTRGGP